MNTMRFNSLQMVHKVIRSMLFKHALEYQKTDFSDKESMMGVLNETEEIIKFVEEHAGIEDHYLFPMIIKYNSVVYDQFIKEHEKDHQLATDLKEKISKYKLASSEELLSIGNALFFSLMNFISFNIDHLTKEETIFNPELWKHYTDLEIMKVSAEVANNLSQERKEFGGIWMVKSCNNTELINWFTALKNSIPSADFNNFITKAKFFLHEERWKKINDKNRFI